MLRPKEADHFALGSDSAKIYHENMRDILNKQHRSSESYLVLESLRSCPSAHHERIVRGKNCYDINAFCFEFIVVLNVRRNVQSMAGGLQARLRAIWRTR